MLSAPGLACDGSNDNQQRGHGLRVKYSSFVKTPRHNVMAFDVADLGNSGSRTPKPNVTRLKSVIGHSMFGIGMYLTARLMEAVD
jgi:hypothetical protein